MTLHFDKDYVSRLLQTYYKDEKEMNVKAAVSFGKIRYDISRKKMATTHVVVHYDIDELVLDENGETTIKHHEIGESEFQNIIKKLLEQAGFLVDDIKLVGAVSNPYDFIGIDVLGRRMEKEKGHTI